MVPWWAQLHIFGGFVGFFWILTPILYYTNVSGSVSFDFLCSSSFFRFVRILSADARCRTEAELWGDGVAK